MVEDRLADLVVLMIEMIRYLHHWLSAYEIKSSDAEVYIVFKTHDAWAKAQLAHENDMMPMMRDPPKEKLLPFTGTIMGINTKISAGFK